MVDGRPGPRSVQAWKRVPQDEPVAVAVFLKLGRLPWQGNPGLAGALACALGATPGHLGRQTSFSMSRPIRSLLRCWKPASWFGSRPPTARRARS